MVRVIILASQHYVEDKQHNIKNRHIYILCLANKCLMTLVKKSIDKNFVLKI